MTNTVLCQISACELSAPNGSRTHTNLHLCKPYPRLSYSHRFKLHSPPHIGRADHTCCCWCCCCPCHTLRHNIALLPKQTRSLSAPLFQRIRREPRSFPPPRVPTAPVPWSSAKVAEAPQKWTLPPCRALIHEIMVLFLSQGEPPGRSLSLQRLKTDEGGNVRSAGWWEVS